MSATSSCEKGVPRGWSWLDAGWSKESISPPRHCSASVLRFSRPIKTTTPFSLELEADCEYGLGPYVLGWAKLRVGFPTTAGLRQRRIRRCILRRSDLQCVSMEMVPVRSSNLAAIGYDPATSEMRILFRNGRLYLYHEVPSSLHSELMAADSKGRYFEDFIRWRYRGTWIG